jgi:Zn finger protein HypA/HybF involved in hydrogenase expression
MEHQGFSSSLIKGIVTSFEKNREVVRGTVTIVDFSNSKYRWQISTNFLAAAEGMVNAEQGAKVESGNEKRHCLNCSTPLTDVYCPHCGQKDIPNRQTLGELVFNFISSFSGYESKFFTTCRYLLFRPGFLATEYNSGKRERYFHPARMYVFISFIFFLLLFSLPDDEHSNTNFNVTTPKEELKDLRKN